MESKGKACVRGVNGKESRRMRMGEKGIGEELVLSTQNKPKSF